MRVVSREDFVGSCESNEERGLSEYDKPEGEAKLNCTSNHIILPADNDVENPGEWDSNCHEDEDNYKDSNEVILVLQEAILSKLEVGHRRLVGVCKVSLSSISLQETCV